MANDALSVRQFNLNGWMLGTHVIVSSSVKRLKFTLHRAFDETMTMTVPTNTNTYNSIFFFFFFVTIFRNRYAYAWCCTYAFESIPSLRMASYRSFVVIIGFEWMVGIFPNRILQICMVNWLTACLCPFAHVHVQCLWVCEKKRPRPPIVLCD